MDDVGRGVNSLISIITIIILLLTPLIDLFHRRHRMSLPFIVVVVCCRYCLSPLSFVNANLIVALFLLCFVVVVCRCLCLSLLLAFVELLLVVVRYHRLS